MRTERICSFLVLLAALGVGGCDRLAKTSSDKPPALSTPDPSRNEIAPDRLPAVLAAHYRGLGAMERYEYGPAVRAFGEVVENAPGWRIGQINLAIALLNQGGEAFEKAKKAGEEELEAESRLNIDKARLILDGVLKHEPDQRTALFSRGIILRSQGDLDAAHRDFARVVELDPDDAHAWLELGSTLTDPDRPGMPAQRPQANRLIEIYTKSLRCNPYLVTAMFKLQWAYNLAGDRAGQQRLFKLFYDLNPEFNGAAPGEKAELSYSKMGRYAEIINPFPRPQPPATPVPPRFGPPRAIQVELPPGTRWAGPDDFVQGHKLLGNLLDRFGVGVATFDADGDGQPDLYLPASVVGPGGLRDALLINRGGGKFEDRTAAMGLPVDRAGTGVAAGDFDADRHLDLFLTGIEDNRLFHFEGGKYRDVTEQAHMARSDAVSLSSRWFDLDQDGDLDLYVVNHAMAQDMIDSLRSGSMPKGSLNAVYRNDGKAAAVRGLPEKSWMPLANAPPDFTVEAGLSIAFSTDFPSIDLLRNGVAPHTGFAALDVDDDRDIDLVLTSRTGSTILLNDREGKFHPSDAVGLDVEASKATQVFSVELDKDGKTDLVSLAENGRVTAWLNATTRTPEKTAVGWKPLGTGASRWSVAVASDANLDTWTDLVGLETVGEEQRIALATNLGGTIRTAPIAFGPVGNRPLRAIGMAYANLAGNPLPDLLIVRPGETPLIAENLGNGQRWVSVDLNGRWKFNFDHMRTNPQGIGTRLAFEGQGLFAPFDASTPAAGPSQSVGPIVVGLGSHEVAPLLHVRWPDGVMQAELNVSADQSMPLAELNRKTGSCPVLFTWNGERFECVGDFVGGAGLGFLEAPGEYHPPDRDESVAIRGDQLRPVDGMYRLSVVEPVDEVAYLDQIRLEVVDRPPGTDSTPDERFSFGEPAPTGEPIAWTRSIEPVAATDHRGRDVMPLLATADRRTVDDFARLRGWIGYTEEHAITLDFGDRLANLSGDDRPTLCLVGWVEYPYSQTNYAASNAGVMLHPPVLERRRPDGTWQVIDARMGHPAGLTRMMTVDLSGKVDGPAVALRIRTDMECYWDRAFVAVGSTSAHDTLRVQSLPVARSNLRTRGYLREGSPDGLMPLLYEYEHVDPAALARFSGFLTKHGEVSSLLLADDDRLCVMGPGDEVQLEFDGRTLPDLPEGWTRQFVFRVAGYCKDADPFTATSDDVGPLPWKGMKRYPFGPHEGRPVDPAYADYLRDHQTRPAGSR